MAKRILGSTPIYLNTQRAKAAGKRSRARTRAYLSRPPGIKTALRSTPWQAKRR
jgi:hypothetical protein